MMIPALVTACDMNDREYSAPVMGAAAIARGATGRWCEVLWFGPEYLQQHPEIKLTERFEAAAAVEAAGDWADF